MFLSESSQNLRQDMLGLTPLTSSRLTERFHLVVSGGGQEVTITSILTTNSVSFAWPLA